PAPGETMRAEVVIRANGNQRFVVGVSVMVAGKKRTESPVLSTQSSVRPGSPTVEKAAPKSLLQAFHSLPKPLLFGIYGLVGGLLGALLIGELLWALVQPAGATVTPLQMAASSSVTAYWGGSNRFG